MSRPEKSRTMTISRPRRYTEFKRSASLAGLPMTPSPSLEPAIRLIGEQLAQLSGGLSPSIFDSRWWSHSAINLAMKDASFKTRLFHFIDVLPVIQDDERVVSLAEEYFGSESSELF